MQLPPAVAASPSPAPVQRKPDGAAEPGHEETHQIAARGTAGAGQPLPHASTIQRLFGRHDISDVKAHVGGPAAPAADQLGARAYASGRSVAFRSEPDLHTAAHEAAHIVQQTGGVQLDGGVGRAGDVYERNADAVADAVVAGHSAERLLDPFAGRGGTAAVQKDAAPPPYDSLQHPTPDQPEPTLASVTQALTSKVKQSHDLTGWTVQGAKDGSVEEVYVLAAIFGLATKKRWGTEADIVTKIGPGKQGAIQVVIDATGHATGTLVSSSVPKVAATFASPAAAISAIQAKYGLAEIKGEKGQAWTVDQLNKLSAAWSRLGASEAAALAGYTLILTDNTLTGPDGGHADGLTTREDKTSSDGMSAIHKREIRFAAGMFDGDLRSFVGDSSNAAPSSFILLLHEVGHASETKAVDDANTVDVTAVVELNQTIKAAERASAKALASRNAFVDQWSHFKRAEQTASMPVLQSFDATHDAITAFRNEVDPIKMSPLGIAAAAAVKARNAASSAVAAKNPVHAAISAAVVDQDAYLLASQDILTKRLARKTTSDGAAGVQDATGSRSKRLQVFIDFVTTNGIQPVTKYAKDNWPANPAEFYAEAFSLWHNDPKFFRSYSAKLAGWFDAGEYLK